MRRRQFVVGAGAGLALAGIGHAQSSKAPVIGFLNSASPALYTFNVAAFREGLREAGFVEGQNVTIEYRWADSRYDRLPMLAAELAALKVSAIAATGDVASARAAQSASNTIPIVFTIGGDPVKWGLVASMNRPGGNITGVSLLSNVLGPKRVQLLHELAPKTSLIALLMNPDNINAASEQNDTQEGARARGLKTIVLNARNKAEIDAAFASIAQQRADALITATDPTLIAQHPQIVAYEARLRLPAMHTVRQFTAIGGLMNYGPSITGMYRQAGLYIGQILRGAKAAELAVIQPTRFEMAINIKTAKNLDLPVPQALLALADELID
jgi:putative ABC transport system substrate-binding protein